MNKWNYIKLIILFSNMIFVSLLIELMTPISNIKCIGELYNRSCLYYNVYYYNRKFYSMADNANEVKCVAIRSRSSNLCFKPKIITHKLKYSKVIEGISTYISLFYTKNIGHLLFDDLYSVYLSLLKFGFKLDPFNIIISHSYSDWRSNRETDIFEKFSMNKLIYESDIKNDVILIKTLIVGLAHHCQRCVNKEYSIPGGREYKATWWMRKRMYYVYNITKCEKKYSLIVNNKRFTNNEKEILKNIIYKYKNKKKIVYIDWRNYPLFEHQLKILRCADIYISGPGTGLLNFPFMSDPGIIINLGTLFRGCPFYMEQYMEEGSMHYISLYYPSNKRIYGLKEDEIIILIDKGIEILSNWKKYKSQHQCNLNIEAIIFKSISKNKPNLMDRFLKARDWGNNVGFGVWAEKLIYFPYCYNTSYIVDAVISEAKKYNNELGCEISNSTKLCIFKSD